MLDASGSQGCLAASGRVLMMVEGSTLVHGLDEVVRLNRHMDLLLISLLTLGVVPRAS